MKERRKSMEREDKEALEAAIDVYMELLPQMLAEGHEGKYVVLRRNDTHPIDGFWHCEEDARKVGYKECGPNETFLVRPVSKEYMVYGKYGKPVEVRKTALAPSAPQSPGILYPSR